MPPRTATAGHRTLRSSLNEYGRGIAGGLLFSLPLLYTMEVWQTGMIATAGQQLAYVGTTFVLLVGYNRYAGLHPDAAWLEVFIDSVEEMGIGLIVAALVLWLAGQIALINGRDEILGKIVLEAMTVAVGVSVGTAQLGTGEHGDESNDSRSKNNGRQPHFLGQLVLAWCGAVLVASNVGPTEEIVLIAVMASSWKRLGIVLASLMLAALILYFSEFVASRRSRLGTGVVTGVITTYAVSLLASALILWFFRRFGGNAAAVNLSEIVVLALPAVLGASAGRLLIQ